MPLDRQWIGFDRSVVHRAPDRPGILEIGTTDGEILVVGHGFVREELQKYIEYRDATRVRWKTVRTVEDAKTLRDEHLDRLSEES